MDDPAGLRDVSEIPFGFLPLNQQLPGITVKNHLGVGRKQLEIFAVGSYLRCTGFNQGRQRRPDITALKGISRDRVFRRPR